MITTNPVRAFLNIIKYPDLRLNNTGKNIYDNRIQIQGQGLEDFIKDSFANTFDADENVKKEKYAKFFKYQGSSNHPPDIILNNSDAVEIKKNKRVLSNIALNSSWPRSKLYKNDSKIKKSVKKFVGDIGIDVLYIIGTIEKKTDIKRIFFIYGDCFVSDTNHYIADYKKISNLIKNSISELPYGSNEETNELGRLNNIDLLQRTNLRIRGMYELISPSKAICLKYNYQGI